MSIFDHHQKQRAWFCGINVTWWTILALCTVWVMVGEWNDPFTVLPAMIVLFPSAALAWAEFRVWLQLSHFLEAALGMLNMVVGVGIWVGVVAGLGEIREGQPGDKLLTAEDWIALGFFLVGMLITGAYLTWCGWLRILWWRDAMIEADFQDAIEVCELVMDLESDRNSASPP